MIREYAQSVAARLAFDPRLAGRIREEVEDHLREAVAGSAEPDAERRAVASFGDARVLAMRLASVSLASQLAAVGLSAVLLAAVLFLAMKARLVWYELTGWALCDRVVALSQLVGSLDRWAFLAGALLGVAAWIHAGKRRLVLCALATGSLGVAVMSDAVLTFLRLDGSAWSGDFAVPLASMALEAACTVWLVLRIRRIARCAAFVSTLERA
jgi:hypothetical protein